MHIADSMLSNGRDTVLLLSAKVTKVYITRAGYYHTKEGIKIETSLSLSIANKCIIRNLEQKLDLTILR